MDTMTALQIVAQMELDFNTESWEVTLLDRPTGDKVLLVDHGARVVITGWGDYHVFKGVLQGTLV